jgi:putative modified peptide
MTTTTGQEYKKVHNPTASIRHGDQESRHQPMDFAAADRLLELLSHDDEFRALFANDWRAALARVGYSDAYSESVACAATSTLASKEEISKARQNLRAYLTGLKPMAMSVIFNFEAGKVESSIPT